MQVWGLADKLTVGSVAISAVLGGTVEVLGGGKFANGAISGAYIMLLNHLAHNRDEGNDRPFGQGDGTQPRQLDIPPVVTDEMLKAWGFEIPFNIDPLSVDAIYVELNASLVFVGGGSVSVGLFLPLVGETAGILYGYISMGFNLGLELGVGIGGGIATYQGPKRLFNMENFLNLDSGNLSGKKLISLSTSISQNDHHGFSLYSRGLNLGPQVGASFSFRKTFWTRIGKIW